MKPTAFALLLAFPFASCTTYKSWQKAQYAESTKDWDTAVREYEKALQIDHDNTKLRIALQRAKLAASRSHFEKGKSLRAAAATAAPADRLRLAQMAATELELAVRLDTTNQFAAVELGKAVQLAQDLTRAADHDSIEEVKRRARRNITKAQPPALDPTSNEPITLTFPRETPVREIYRALGAAFGINILFDQAIKDDRITIELRDVTAQQALERVMQAANHFYKVLDERSIIVVPDNPQARRDYEDLVIRTFYLSNGDAEQVTNVVRTMIEARNVFPLKALNAITIRDTADKVLIAEKIIEANDKAKSEVVVDLELLQLDVTKALDIGAQLISGAGSYNPTAGLIGANGVGTAGEAITSLTIPEIRRLGTGNLSFTLPSVYYGLIKNSTNAELLAKPQLRISEGEKATLHIGQRIPVPVTTFQAITPGTGGGTQQPFTSYQYQDIGIKIGIEPRVHHNREVTLKISIEVSNVAGFVGQQPIIGTRQIDSTIRLKDGETNFLAGLIRRDDSTVINTLPFIGDIPILGKLFSRTNKNGANTDLVLTMSPNIIRIPDITEDDLAPMWVGTTNVLTFRGMSPRLESQGGVDPFAPTRTGLDQFDRTVPVLIPPTEGPRPENRPGLTPPPPAPTPPGATPQSPSASNGTGSSQDATVALAAATVPDPSSGRQPRIAPQPSTLALKPGEERSWSVVGMDLDGLTTTELLLHFDARSIDVAEVRFGPAFAIDALAPPIATINRESGTVKITSSDGKPLSFAAGGEVLSLRVRGTMPGESFLVLESPELRTASGQSILSAISGGRAKVD
ncbi:MAG TPA: hypothetical protein VFL80_11690 [Thermoanaerobaculia bacterium]|nr:hypothetical protein [Thermoanaerobaculia bacterium]